MKPRQAFTHWHKAQGYERVTDDYPLPRTLAALEKHFPDASVYLYHPPGRGANLRVLFTPSKESPYVFETFAAGYDHVDVFDKRHVSVPSSSMTACCTVLLPALLHGEVGYMPTNYLDDHFTFRDFDNPVRVQELIAADVHRRTKWRLEAGTERKPGCSIL
jgi:hypothetical protein